jgi:hypothetical protein
MSHTAAPEPKHFGLMAEFETPQALLDAAHAVRKAGYTKSDAFSPFPIHGLAEALGFHESKIPKFVLAGGIAGLVGGYGLEYWSQVIAYPLNIGGRPYHSWVAFIPPAYETTILLAALSCFGSLLFLCGFPAPYHPVFNAPRFSMATSDKFFLVIEETDPKFTLDGTRAFLSGLNAKDVVHVEN